MRLLGRDRNFLVQTLLLPVVIVASQVFFGTPGDWSLDSILKPVKIAMIAFGITLVVSFIVLFRMFFRGSGPDGR